MYEFLSYRVEDAMSRDVVTIDPRAPLSEAERVFEARGFNGLPVVDDAGELVGFLTQLDLLRAFHFSEDHMFPPYAEIMHGPVAKWMQRDVLTTTELAPLTRVLETLVEKRVKSLVVIRDKRPVGVVSREDVLTALRRAASGERVVGLPAIEPV